MSKFSTLLFPILNEILVKEIGESNISPLKWKKIYEEHYEFEITINNLMKRLKLYLIPYGLIKK